MTAGEDENVENVPPTEVITDSDEKKIKTPEIITLEILKVIKDAQQQHGLRHADYQRYRGYCSRRIRRLRKVTHILQGDRRHYKRRDVTTDNLVDQRSLLIPLMMAERAWGYAMQLRQEANTEPRKKFHLVSRMRKAATHALALEEICTNANCDPRTKLEAQAYVAWIHGSLHFELQLWKTAMEHLKKAQVVYEKLAEVVSEVDVAIYRHRVDELNPSIRYCAYNTGDVAAGDDLLTLRTHGDLLANFDALLAKRQQDSSGGDGGDLKWRGFSFPLRPERVRLYILADQQLDAALGKAKNVSEKLQLLEDNLLDCKDAIASLRDLLRTDPSSKVQREQGQPLPPLQMLLTFLTYTRLSRTVERNLLMAEQQRTGGGEKKPRPQDLARFNEMVLQNLQEMAALPGLESDQALQKELNAKTSLYKAIRCYYIAEYLVTQKRWKEALGMYGLADKYHNDNKGKSGASLAAEWDRLKADLEKSQFSVLAHSVLDDEPAEEGQSTKQFRSRKPLAERLDEYKEESTLLTKNPGVVKLPPEMRPIPCKPLFFDLALNFAEFPNLDHKMDAAGRRQNPSGLTGFVKGFLGWGK